MAAPPTAFGPLTGIRVLDLTTGLAGPFATKILGDWGADVLKVEPPDGDPARRLGPFRDDLPHPETSGTFLALNSNKRGITLDLTSASGRKLARRLIARSDIVVESFGPGGMEARGLAYEELARDNLRLVLTRLSNFGQTGPYKDYVLSELTLYAMGGPMNSTGLPDREPVKLGGASSTFQAGNVAATATVIAYFGALRHGRGQEVDVSLFETAMGSIDRRMGNLTVHQYSGGLVSKREETRAGGFPSGVYPCADGYFALAGGILFFPRIARMVGRPELADDPYWCSPEAQADPLRREEFEATIFLPWLLTHTKAECLAAGQANNVLCGAVNTMEDVLNDPHFQAREYWVTADHQAAGTLTYPGAQMKFSVSPWSFRMPAPLLGQHNTAVYCDELGLSRQELVLLRERGTV